MTITKIKTHLVSPVEVPCKSARLFSTRSSKENNQPKHKMGMTEFIPPLYENGMNTRNHMKTTHDKKESDSETSTVQILPYLTKQPTGTLST